MDTFNRHQERPILGPLRQLDVAAERRKELQDRLIRQRALLTV
jgi:hypothetical protein